MTRDLADTVKALGEPFGYAYGYPDGIRFDTGGRAINGNRPTSAIALYTAAQLEPVIRGLVAQATADALEVVKQLIHDAAALAMVNEKHGADVGNKMIEYSRNVVQRYLYDLRQQVVALIPADIAAKAKEWECFRCREPKQCLAIPLDAGAHEPLCAECISLMLGEAHELMGAARKFLVTKDVRESEIKTALSILVENSPGAALNAVTEDFPWLVEGLAKIRREAYLRCANAASERDYKIINDFNNAKNEPSLTYMFDKWAEEADGGGK
jgi:hypothetical protein